MGCYNAGVANLSSTGIN